MKNSTDYNFALETLYMCIISNKNWYKAHENRHLGYHRSVIECIELHFQ